MVFCEDCGYTLKPNAKFCGSCGTSASENPTPSQFTVKKIRTSVAFWGFFLICAALVLLYFPLFQGTIAGAPVSWSFGEVNTMCLDPQSRIMMTNSMTEHCPFASGYVTGGYFMILIGISLIVLSVAWKKTVVV